MPAHDESRQMSEVSSERDLLVEMRDGIKIALDVFRPSQEGKFPALLAMSPYGKDIQSIGIPPQPPEGPLIKFACEAGDSEYLVSQGYAHVIADVRGSGKSQGEYRGWMSKQEAEDGYDIVEWIAGQPWCDGNVGMVGISYFGTVQLSVAAERPPHLKAIMPWNAPADFYREACYHGGILQTFFFYLYGNSIRGYGISVTAKDNSIEEVNRLVEAARRNPDVRMYPEIYNIVVNPERIPGYFDIILHPTDGPFYWERSAYTKYDQLRIPAYFSSGWWAYSHMHLRGAFQHYAGISAPKKMLIEDRVVHDRPLPQQYNEEAVRWYDYWLKGRDTGIMDEPPIKLFVMGRNQWRSEQEWPLPSTKWTKYYLRRWEGLSPEPEDCPGRPDWFVQQPPDETASVAAVNYMTAPMKEDCEVTGPIALNLYAAIDADDTNWIVALIDVAEGGAETELTSGFLKASHRAIDEDRSTPWLPYHPHTDPEPIVPGEVCEYAIELSPTSFVFRAGHRIKLKIMSMDHPRSVVASAAVAQIHVPWHMCSSTATVHRIFHDRTYPSHLLLPVIPPRDGT